MSDLQVLAAKSRLYDEAEEPVEEKKEEVKKDEPLSEEQIKKDLEAKQKQKIVEHLA